jgi:hypothetical protein
MPSYIVIKTAFEKHLQNHAVVNGGTLFMLKELSLNTTPDGQAYAANLMNNIKSVKIIGEDVFNYIQNVTSAKDATSGTTTSALTSPEIADLRRILTYKVPGPGTAPSVFNVGDLEKALKVYDKYDKIDDAVTEAKQMVVKACVEQINKVVDKSVLATIKAKTTKTDLSPLIALIS